MPTACPNCRAAIDPNDAFCPNCGTSLVMPSNPLRTTNQSTAAMAPVAAAPRGVQPQRQAAPRRATATPTTTRKRPWYRKKRVMLPLTFLIILGMIGGGSAWYLNNRFGAFNEISTPDSDSPAGQALSNNPATDVTPTADGAITVLMMGVDARDGEAIDIGVRPDSLSVLHINPEARTCRILSIPRDTRTELPGYGQSKINHALSVGGIPYQKLVTENLLGIQIDHYALVDFAGVVGVVDALGGVDVTNQTAFELDGVSFPAGPQHLNGEQALLYSRFRGDAEGDFGRQRRQQEVITALLRKADGLDAARAIPSLLGSIEGHFKTDLSIPNLIGLAGKYRDYCSADSAESAGIDGTVGNAMDDLSGQELSFVHVTQEEIDAKVVWLLGRD